MRRMLGKIVFLLPVRRIVELYIVCATYCRKTRASKPRSSRSASSRLFSHSRLSVVRHIVRSFYFTVLLFWRATGYFPTRVFVLFVRRIVLSFYFTMKSKGVVQSTLLTPGPNRFTRALHPRGNRDPLRLAEGGALPCKGARHPFCMTCLPGPRA